MTITEPQVILVLSGKGGVGKSFVSVNVALYLSAAGYRVGLLDADLTGPNLPLLLGQADASIKSSQDGKWIPARVTDNLQLLSIALLLPNTTDPVIWRGPKKSALINQFLKDVDWGQIDYLIIDTPPGTSDEHLSLVQGIANPTAILVSTPQAVSLSDVRKEYDFCKRSGIQVLGLIENMAGFTCPDCKECSLLFSSGGGEALAKEFNFPFLGSIPIDPSITEKMHNYPKEFINLYKNSTLWEIFENVMTRALA
jgi:Mrp family chromosome partitioning ATPase